MAKVPIGRIEKWQNIYDPDKKRWYVLTQTAKETITLAVCGMQEFDKKHRLTLEHTTHIDGKGNGYSSDVLLSSLCKHFYPR